MVKSQYTHFIHSHSSIMAESTKPEYYLTQLGKTCACRKNFHYAWYEPFRTPILLQSKVIHLGTCVPMCNFRSKHRNTSFGLCLEKIISQIIFAKSVGVFENLCNIQNNTLINYVNVIKECVAMNFNVNVLIHVRSLCWEWWNVHFLPIDSATIWS